MPRDTGAMAHCRVALIGAPTDVGAGLRGGATGPEAMRVAGLASTLRDAGHDVLDRGDLRGPGDAPGAMREGCRQLDAVVAWNQLVHDAVAHELRARRVPVLLGGDHSLAIGSISAVARHCRAAGKRLLVIWFDAHADCNVATTSPSGNLHGMGVACLLGLGPASLTHLSDRHPALDRDAIRLVGVRSIDPGERELVRELGITVMDMREFDVLGPRAAMQALLSDIDDDTHVHVSFDVDFLDPAVAPGVGTPVAGGPDENAARTCLAMLASTGCVRSVDVMELNPLQDLHNDSALRVAGLLRELLAAGSAQPSRRAVRGRRREGAIAA